MTRDCSLNSPKNTSSEHVVYKYCFECQNKNKKNNFCTQHVVNLYFSENSMNNLLSYCGLTNARMRASEKDLPVMLFQMLENIFVYQTYLLNVLSSIYLAIGRRISSFSWMYVAVLRMIFHSFKMYFELQSLN